MIPPTSSAQCFWLGPSQARSWSADLLLLFIVALLPATALAQFYTTVTRPAMGTPWRITLCTTDTLLAHRAIDSAFLRIEQVEQSMSDYRTDSEINTLSRLPAHRYHPISADLYRVLAFSQQLHRDSRGAFDVTIGRLTKRWRRALRQQSFPTNITQRAGPRVRRMPYRLHPSKGVWLAHDSLAFDLGGVAKGCGLDAAGEALKACGIDAFLIDGGGDLLLGEPPPGLSGWTVALPSGTIDTAGVAIASSGASYRYLLHAGQRYSHIIDPRTGLGVTHGETVTVMAPTGMGADGLASALSVLATRRQALARKYAGLTFLISQADGRSAVSTESP